LKFTLGQSEEVTISIYNIIGQRIEIIHHGVFAAGTHSIKWDITQAGVPLPAGVYIFTLRIGSNRVLQQKGLYIK
jgi:flagellar hook assembly protein FlgD